MKKLNYFLLGAAGLLLASCSQEQTVNAPANGDGNVHFTVKLPNSVSTRATENSPLGNGYASTQLTYAAYDATTKDMIAQGVTNFDANALETQVDLNLAKGMTYNVVFFAQSPQSTDVYVYNVADGTLNVNYANMTGANNIADAYDCFYATEQITVSDTAEENNATAQLYRPLAQINWGTNDLTAAEGTSETVAAAHAKAYGENGQYIMASLTTQAYSQFDFLSQTVVGEAEEVTIEASAAPYDYIFPIQEDGVEVSDYVYVAMNYVLVGQAYVDSETEENVSASATYNMTLNINNSGNGNDQSANYSEVQTEVFVASVPVGANYQTNIYGALLTTNTEITVKKNPEWAGSYQIGNVALMPPTNSEGQYVVTNEGNLAWIAQQVNSGADNFSGKTFVLSSDIYVTAPVTPIGNKQYAFSGTFDGNDNTIYNLVIEGDVNNSANAMSNSYVGLFGKVNNATITDLTIDGVNISSNDTGYGNFIGSLAGSAASSTFENITITGDVNINISGGVVGGVIGTISSCNLTGVSVDSESGLISVTQYAGGIVGTAGYSSDATIENCTSNIAVIGKSGNQIGGIIGALTCNPKSGDDVTITFSGCENKGSLSCPAKHLTGNLPYLIGGIVGAWNNAAYTIKFQNCTNEGTITSANASTDDFDLEENNALIGMCSTTNLEGTTPLATILNGDDNITDSHFYFGYEPTTEPDSGDNGDTGN